MVGGRMRRWDWGGVGGWPAQRALRAESLRARVACMPDGVGAKGGAASGEHGPSPQPLSTRIKAGGEGSQIVVLPGGGVCRGVMGSALPSLDPPRGRVKLGGGGWWGIGAALGSARTAGPTATQRQATHPPRPLTRPTLLPEGG